MLKGFGGKLAHTKAGKQILKLANERHRGLAMMGIRQAFFALGRPAAAAVHRTAAPQTPKFSS